MLSLDDEGSWNFIPVTIAIWIVMFVVMELVFFDGTLVSGIIQGFLGGLAYSATVKALKYAKNRE